MAFRDGLVNFSGGHRAQLLCGGDELFPSLIDALAQAQHDVWVATYIFNDDQSGKPVAQALIAAAERGVKVHVVVDGFGSKTWIAALRELMGASAVRFEVFRSLDRWWSWFQPQQLRRMHQKLVAIDDRIAYVGGINLIDDRFDIHHGWSAEPRLDFAVRLEGPVAVEVSAVVQALWTRAHQGQRGWRHEFLAVVRAAQPASVAVDLFRQLRRVDSTAVVPTPNALLELPPVRAGLVVRDNIRRRRSIERAYIQAIDRAQLRIDIACPYFYPGRRFCRALVRAAARGVQIRLLLQGKVDYRIAALAARVLYEDLLSRGMAIYEYTPAFLHAKVAVVDAQWATVGSSNIDPFSLLLNLEANVVLLDEDFVRGLNTHLELAFSNAQQVVAPTLRRGWRSWLMRGLVAWVANAYLRMAGIVRRY
jgi:cardiolipin synthase A/B